MLHSLAQRVHEVQSTAARLTWLYGLARFAATAIALVIFACLLDYLLRLHDPAARWLVSAAAAAIMVWAFITLAWPSFRHQRSPIATAQRIERRYPELGERLSSAIAFLAQTEDDATSGSADLRRAVIAEAEALSSGVDFQASLDRRAARGAIVAALTGLVIACVLVALNPSAAVLAARRLAQPGRDLPWPRRHELVFVEAPQRLAVGDDVELAVINRRGPLPDSVRFLWRFQTPGGSRMETKEMKPLGDRMVLRLDNVTRGFEYRASGGDDDTMPWTELTVVEPPKILELQVFVEPPAYTGLAARSEGRIATAFMGSRLSIRGKLDQPIRSAAIKPLAPESLLPSVEVSADGRQFSVPAAGATWTVEHSMKFSFELTDQHGLTSGRDTRIELRAAPDTPPAISWEAPGDHSFVTSRAVIPLKGAVKDDLAVRNIQLRFLHSGQSDEEQVVDLYTGQGASQPAQTAEIGDSRQFASGWALANLPGLGPGDVLGIRITAEDYKPQLATTTVRRVTIITEDELERRVAARQAVILEQLADALRLARRCREQTQSLELRLSETSQVAATELNLLQAAQHSQRQVERLLGTSPEGAEGQITSLLDELAANGSDKQASGHRLRELLSRVRELNDGPLPVIDQHFTEAIKTGGAPTAGGAGQDLACGDTPAADVLGRVKVAGAKQVIVVESLERIVGRLSEWDSFGRIAREIGQIRTDQARLAGETEELKLKVASAALELATVDREAARRLSEQQLELARRLDKLQTRMEEMLARLTADDPLAASTLASALDAARRLAIGGQMREAAARLPQLHLGQANETQKRALDALQQLVQSLSSGNEQDRVHEQLARARQTIAGIATRQQVVIEQTVQVESQREREGALDGSQASALAKLTAEQRLLTQATEQLRPQLAAAPVFGLALEGAADNMRRAVALLARGQTAAPTQNAERIALSRLQQVLEALRADEPAAATDPPLSEQQPAPSPEPDELAGMVEELKLLKLLQQSINDRTAELEAERTSAQTFSIEQQQELDELARTQGRLAETVLGWIESKGRHQEEPRR